VFGDPSLPHPPVSAAVSSRLDSALGELSVFGVAEDRTVGLRESHSLAAAETVRLAGQAAVVDQGDRAARSPNQDYFCIRTAQLTGDEAAAENLRVIRDAVGDLVDAPLAGSDLARTINAIRLVLRRSVRFASTPDSPRPREAERALPTDHQRWMRRWIIAHQLHAMFNVYGAYAVGDAIRGLREGDEEVATRELSEAAVLVTAFAPARAQALAVPPEFYEEVLRPTMLPPLTNAPLSGRMHDEYQAFQTALAALVSALPDTVTELARTNAPLALARERLFEADLIEAERHITLIEPLIGSARSIVQGPRSVDNAVTVLRRIRHQRAARAAPFMRFADRLASDPAPRDEDPA
jgi:hypothetical protein